MTKRSLFLSWFYASLLTGAALSCVVTAFALPASLAVIWLVSAAAAGLIVLLYRLPKQGLSLSAAALAYALTLWQWRETVAEGFSASLETITYTFSRAYPGLRTLSLLSVPADTDATLCFAALAIPMVAALLWTLTRQLPVWLPLLLCAPWLGLCMVVVNEMPALWALCLLLGGCILLALTADARRGDGKNGLRLSLSLSIPVALLTVGLMLLQPPGEYRRAEWIDALREGINEKIYELSGKELDEFGLIKVPTPTAPQVMWSASYDVVDLAALEKRADTGGTVMELWAETNGYTYLRGASLAEYSGNAWRSASLSSALDPLEIAEKAEYTLYIRTRAMQPVLFTPYYPVEMARVRLNDEYYYNAMQLKEYAISYDPTPEITQHPEAYLALAYNAYCQLATETAEALYAIAETAGLTALSQEQLPDAVAKFVSESAEYDLEPSEFPTEADFPVWFLTEAEQGYCVHFATATATMLRALGIPARYVTGFLTDARYNRWVDVTDRDAHAWVEYWHDDIGWVPLETTPGDGRRSGTVIKLPEKVQPEIDQPEQTELPTPDKPALPELPEKDDTPNYTAPEKKADRSWQGWLAAALIAAALVSSRWLRQWWRRRSVRGSTNEQALRLWHQIDVLCSYLNVDSPQEVQTLAEKARFSQHTLQPEELAAFYESIEVLREALQQQEGSWAWFRNRWIWAVC